MNDVMRLPQNAATAYKITASISSYQVSLGSEIEFCLERVRPGFEEPAKMNILWDKTNKGFWDENYLGKGFADENDKVTVRMERKGLTIISATFMLDGEWKKLSYSLVVVPMTAVAPKLSPHHERLIDIHQAVHNQRTLKDSLYGSGWGDLQHENHAMTRKDAEDCEKMDKYLRALQVLEARAGSSIIYVVDAQLFVASTQKTWPLFLYVYPAKGGGGYCRIGQTPWMNGFRRAGRVIA